MKKPKIYYAGFKDGKLDVGRDWILLPIYRKKGDVIGDYEDVRPVHIVEVKPKRKVKKK